MPYKKLLMLTRYKDTKIQKIQKIQNTKTLFLVRKTLPKTKIVPKYILHNTSCIITNITV